MNRQKGQSLVEVIVAIGIAAVFLGAGVAAIAPIIRTNLETRTIQFADSLAQDYVNKAKNFSESNWTSLYNLSKGSGNNYMLIASGTQTLVVEGQESSPDQDVVSGLVGHWKFDEATSTQAYDFSGNGHGGTLTNGPIRTASSSCELGGCLSFDGIDDFVNIAYDTDLNLKENLSISFWYYKSAETNDHDVFLKRGYNYSVYWRKSDNIVYLQWSKSTGENQWIVCATPSSLNQWNHIAFTANFNGGNGYCYQNGALDKTASSLADVYQSTADFQIGRNSTGPTYSQNIIDDIRIYNRALSESEIKQLYNSRKYLRSFSVDNVNRDSCGAGNISTEATSTCSTGPGTTGVAEDPSTQKITINVNWSGGGSAGSAISKIQYFARTANLIFNQTDWFGGASQEGPITAINDKFATSTNVNYSSDAGSITILGY